MAAGPKTYTDLEALAIVRAYQMCADWRLMMDTLGTATDIAHDTRSPRSRFVNWFARPWYGHRASRDGWSL